ncbi:hypothetical protein [Endozoicomonas sp. ISHI1]|uniref:hypothetical protein n=2 Tax=unclassified Endozoicomonas TaxID=2644528 RepID=UPI002148DB9C|nr:hypothetical protein [Endozoicomonas sp. ISHI1]
MDGINNSNNSVISLSPLHNRTKTEKEPIGVIMGKNVTVHNKSEAKLLKLSAEADAGPSTVAHAATFEEATRTIERFLKNNSGNELLSTLGMTAEGRIVLLAEQDECQQPKLRRALEQQLEALLPENIARALKEREVENTVSTEFKTLVNFRNRTLRDRQIRNRLMELERQYTSEFKKLDELTTTEITVLDAALTTGSNEPDEPFAEYRFRNEFTQDRWKFIDNRKSGAIKPKDFYMSNVIARQFKLSFDSFGWLLELPKIIDREMMTNQKTIETLIEHQKDYDSDAFMSAFLETTVNGKSTVNVARDLGLIIERITVSYNGKLVKSIDEPITIRHVKHRFDVHVHVRPDKALYDSI